jgi:hypothetical protein
MAEATWAYVTAQVWHGLSTLYCLHIDEMPWCSPGEAAVNAVHMSDERGGRGRGCPLELRCLLTFTIACAPGKDSAFSIDGHASYRQWVEHSSPTTCN